MTGGKSLHIISDMRKTSPILTKHPSKSKKKKKKVETLQDIVQFSESASPIIKKLVQYHIRMSLSYITVCPSQKEMASRHGCSREWINKCHRELDEDGLVKKFRRGKWYEKKTNIYRVMPLLRERNIIRQIAPHYDFNVVGIIYCYSVVNSPLYNNFNAEFTRNKILINNKQDDYINTRKYNYNMEYLKHRNGFLFSDGETKSQLATYRPDVHKKGIRDQRQIALSCEYPPCVVCLVYNCRDHLKENELLKKEMHLGGAPQS